jgi:hypothetical protein
MSDSLEPERTELANGERAEVHFGWRTGPPGVPAACFAEVRQIGGAPDAGRGPLNLATHRHRDDAGQGLDMSAPPRSFLG